VSTPSLAIHAVEKVLNKFAEVNAVNFLVSLSVRCPKLHAPARPAAFWRMIDA
jgi:hypothetical protein